MISCKASSFVLENPICQQKEKNYSLKGAVGNFQLRPSHYHHYQPAIRCCSSSIDGHLTSTSHDYHDNVKKKKLLQTEEIRKVNCQVEVISWRERRIKAQITVNADIQSVWTALTDYERLADYIPNLVCSGRIPCPHPGRIWLEQRGLQRALYWHIEARVVLDLQEFPISANNHELHFSMVDGDFKKFDGKWSLKSGARLDSHCTVDEVHLRRFDGLLENGGVHRCVVASITVKAPVREVWKVLTAYESLPE
ncbi:hypothetical protein GH714_005136 [Hevea brasiliensis]|uniref:Coenzyme Q-binding protein COQ10 START domain-containing protein n=1 Tax=Hevea brasiliensis TaxID=3981 RepID=A0A6A6K5A5_HEVBR|nr:hypothetical protein GH714_005136 [Hevea brasiliensis]